MSEEAGSGIPDERVMAAIAHATVVFSPVGLVGPVIIWAMQKQKSPFVAFQALQAAAYQFLLFVGGCLAGALYACSFLSIPITALLASPLDEGSNICFPFTAFTCTFDVLLILMLTWMAFEGYGLYAAVSVLQGNDFRYLFLGRLLERYLGRS